MSAPSIPPGPEGERVREAFATLKYDPSNPDHWFRLLNSYIEASPRPRGAPRKWTAPQLTKLMHDVGEMESRWKHAYGEKPSRDKIFRELAKPTAYLPLFKKFKEKTKTYRGLKWTTLKKAYYLAWMPEHNSLLACSLDQLAKDWETEDGSNSRERLLIWMKTGVTDVYADKSGNVVELRPRGLRPRVVAK